MCAADPDKPAVCTRYTWAFISVHGEDEVRDFPTTIPARSNYAWNPAANWYFRDAGAAPRIAAHAWSSLLDGTLGNTPEAGGLDGDYWTGSREDGRLASTCAGWTQNVFGIYGNVGRNAFSCFRWVSRAATPCPGRFYVLCACF